MGDILVPRQPQDIASSTVRRKEGEVRPRPINLVKLESPILMLEIAKVRADRRTTTLSMEGKYGAVWKTHLGGRNCKDHKEDAPQITLNGTPLARRRPAKATNLPLNGNHDVFLENTETKQAIT
ncbi:unnamed protein product [Brassica oleracea var. botrytis]|uniref:Uncharacterized protein n=1 Tax=Brassica oleracea TaxID=3712 RepID=A0A3P6DQW5_BRAOL|nr:unnamed protein product [Brassica oleracea]